jgi:hypothetical protein
MQKLDKEEDIQRNSEETLAAIQKELRIQQRTSRARPQGFCYASFFASQY